MAAVNTQNDGLLVLAEGANPIVADIVFVHGLRGDRTLTWTRDDVCWPRDLLPQDMMNVRIMSWGYDSSISKFSKSTSQNSISSHATSLLADLSYVRLQDPEDTRPIIFVGHSLGGLLIKEALLRSAECWDTKQHPRLGSLQKHTKGVIFLGTPHRGSDKAQLAQTLTSIVSVVRQPNDKMQRTLDLDSDVLERQRNSFAAQFKDLPLVYFFEEHPTKKLGIVVSQTSACVDGYNTTSISIPDTHAGICKYSDKNSTGYRRTVGELKIMVTNITTRISEHLCIRKENAAKAILRSFKFPEMKERLEEIERAHQHTYEWMLKNPGPGFLQWLEHGNGIFWLSGKAGSGKSTLMKYLFGKEQKTKIERHLEKWKTGTPLVAMFCFHHRGTLLQKSQYGLLQSILYQVLKSDPSLMPSVLPRVWSRVIKNEYGSCLGVKAAWKKSSLLKAFARLVNQVALTKNVLLLIDGLDECDGDHVDIVHMLENFASTAAPTAGGMKLCISSRPLQKFESAFADYPKIRLQDLTSDDIKLYVSEALEANKQMQHMRIIDAAACRTIVNHIVKNASGVFMWVRLVLNIVLESLQNLDRVPEIIGRLEKLPVDLEDLYAQMLSSITKHYHSDGSRLFRIFSCSMTDSMDTIDLSLASEGSNFATQMKVGPLTNVEEHDRLVEMEAWLRVRCAGLLEVKQHAMGGSTVRYLHLTTKEFLTKPEILSLLDSRINDINFDPHEHLLAGQLARLKFRYERFSVGNQFLPSHAPSVRRPVRPGTELCLILKRALYHAHMAEQTSKKCHEELLDEVGHLYTHLRHGVNVVDETSLGPSRIHGWCTMNTCSSVRSSWLKICLWAQLALYIGKKDVLASAMYCCGLSIGTVSSMLPIACSRGSQKLGYRGRDCIQIRPAFILSLLRLQESRKAMDTDTPDDYWLYCAELDRANFLNQKLDDVNGRYPQKENFHHNKEQTRINLRHAWKSLVKTIQNIYCDAVSRGSAIDRDWLTLFIELVKNEYSFLNRRISRHPDMKPMTTCNKWSTYHILFRVFRDDDRGQVAELFALLKRRGATITTAEAEVFPELSGAPRELVARDEAILDMSTETNDVSSSRYQKWNRQVSDDANSTQLHSVSQTAHAQKEHREQRPILCENPSRQVNFRNVKRKLNSDSTLFAHRMRRHRSGDFK
ncbi:hypothetical protein MMC17_004863 [Xylographa soralifera]|nr:hypothetical protein [Xylographa soralifera]